MSHPIRRARRADLPGLHRIWLAGVRETHGFLSESDVQFYSAMLRDDYLPIVSLLVATDAADVALGFVGRDGDRIDALFVDPAQQRRGIGRALIDAAFGREETVRLNVNEANVSARRFYRRLGFVETGRSSRDGSGRPYPLIHLSHAGSA